jgi:hypothetical protein
MDPRRRHLLELDPAAQAAAVRRVAIEMGLETAAQASGWSAEAILAALQRPQAPECRQGAG